MSLQCENRKKDNKKYKEVNWWMRTKIKYNNKKNCIENTFKCIKKMHTHGTKYNSEAKTKLNTEWKIAALSFPRFIMSYVAVFFF